MLPYPICKSSWWISSNSYNILIYPPAWEMLPPSDQCAIIIGVEEVDIPRGYHPRRCRAVPGDKDNPIFIWVRFPLFSGGSELSLPVRVDLPRGIGQRINVRRGFSSFPTSLLRSDWTYHLKILTESRFAIRTKYSNQLSFRRNPTLPILHNLSEARWPTFGNFQNEDHANSFYTC